MVDALCYCMLFDMDKVMWSKSMAGSINTDCSFVGLCQLHTMRPDVPLIGSAIDLRTFVCLYV